MPLPKLTKLELQIMEALWSRGPCSVREIQESFPAKKRPAYTTVQTTVYRLEVKKALRRVKKISTANIFEAAVSREAAERRLIDDLLGLFGGRSRPIMAHLVESGSLTLDDVREAEKDSAATRRGGQTKMNFNRRPSVAVDSLRRDRLAADAGSAKESRPSAPLALAGGLYANFSSRFLCSSPWAVKSTFGTLRQQYLPTYTL